MLQQTQVGRVLDRYPQFLERFPTLESVAAASAAQVSEAWTGLGYYARARNLHALARQVVPVGRPASPSPPPSPDQTEVVPCGNGLATLPAEAAALRAFPGVGPYTAGAVSSFAYERPAPLVDTNVARVLTRVFAPRYDPRTARGRRIAWAIAARILPRSGAVAYTHNQALIELGALVCTARVAHCEACPIRRMCKTGSR